MSKPTTCTKADLEVDRPVSSEQQPPPTRFAGRISSSSGPTLENGPARSCPRPIHPQPHARGGPAASSCCDLALAIHCWWFSDEAVHGISWYWVSEPPGIWVWLEWLFWGLCCVPIHLGKARALSSTAMIATPSWPHVRWRDSSDGSENFTRGRISPTRLLVCAGAVLVHCYIAYTIHLAVFSVTVAITMWLAREPWRVYIGTPFESEFSAAWRRADTCTDTAEDGGIRRFSPGAAAIG